MCCLQVVGWVPCATAVNWGPLLGETPQNRDRGGKWAPSSCPRISRPPHQNQQVVSYVGRPPSPAPTPTFPLYRQKGFACSKRHGTQLDGPSSHSQEVLQDFPHLSQVSKAPPPHHIHQHGGGLWVVVVGGGGDQWVVLFGGGCGCAPTEFPIPLTSQQGPPAHHHHKVASHVGRPPQPASGPTFSFL